jgi:UDP-N-acetylglucosamine 2-epimerase
MVIWGGNQCYGPLVTKLCETKGIPKIYIEWGMLPQSENFLVDPCGFCGDSILNYNLDWIEERDMNQLYNKREQLQKIYPIENHEYILVPMQLNNDTQVLYYTKYKNMNDFIEDLLLMYPNNKIILKPHPKAGIDPNALYDSLKNNIKHDNLSIADKNQNFMELASKAMFIVGLTSTTLYESAILGKNVITMGNHPLKTFHNQTDKVLAGALALNINRSTGNLKSILDRFNIKPLI